MWVLQVGEGGRLECAGIGGTLIPLETMDREIIKKKKTVCLPSFRASTGTLRPQHNSAHTHTHTHIHTQPTPLTALRRGEYPTRPICRYYSPRFFFFFFSQFHVRVATFAFTCEEAQLLHFAQLEPTNSTYTEKDPPKKKKLRALMRPAERPMRPSTNARSGAHLRRAAHAQCSAPAPPASAAHAQSRTRQQRRPARRRGGG